MFRTIIVTYTIYSTFFNPVTPLESRDSSYVKLADIEGVLKTGSDQDQENNPISVNLCCNYGEYLRFEREIKEFDYKLPNFQCYLDKRLSMDRFNVSIDDEFGLNSDNVDIFDNNKLYSPQYSVEISCEFYYISTDVLGHDKLKLQVEDEQIFFKYKQKDIYTSHYCLARTQNSTNLIGMSCGREFSTRVRYIPICMMITLPFLAIILYYNWTLKDVRDILLGRFLLFFVIWLMVAYTLYSVVQSVVLLAGVFTIAEPVCFILALVTYFSFISSYLWFSIITFETWYTLGETKQRVTDSRIIKYNCVAWGGAAIASMIVFILTINSNISEAVRPKLHTVCWFHSSLQVFLYYILPLFLIFMFNAVFILLMTYKIKKSDCDRNLIKDRRYNLITRMFVIMSVSSSMHIMSEVYDDIDTIGSLRLIFKVVMYMFSCHQGVFLFLLLICNPQVKALISKGYRRGVCRRRTQTFSENISQM